MLHRSTTLSPAALDAVSRLEREVVEHDGGRLKLEWPTLRSRQDGRVHDLLWEQDGRVVGFAGLYQYRETAVEVTGMVAPGARGRGIGGALLTEALGLVGQRGLADALLVVPRTSQGGAQLARSRRGRLVSSEHALVLREVPADTAVPVAVRPAAAGDASTVSRLLEAGFGSPDAGDERTLVADLDGRTVATLRVEREPARAGVYGFVVEPALRGRGIGGAVLRRVCRDLFADGAGEVALEVAVDNDRALGLYTALGFRPVATEDYWSLPVPPPVS